MGSHDFFKKRREERKVRRYGYKTPKANSYLIVTEGKCTEPLYFRGMQKLIREKIGGTIDVVEMPAIDIYGAGCSTRKLIEKTEQLVKNAKVFYQNIWVVFDKDDFMDFDDAIREGTEKGYHIAWSNQSFEYWIYLHFNYSDSALHRDEWVSKLDSIFKQYNLGEGKYHKNYENIYDIVNTYDGVNTAIKNAKRRMVNYNEREKKASEYNPGTQVHLLVEELKGYLEE